MRINKLIRYAAKAIPLFLFICRSEILIRFHKPLKGNYNKLIHTYILFKNRFKKYKDYNDNINRQLIKSEKQIHCGFIIYTSSIWNYDELFDYLTQDNRFIADIIVAHYSKIDKDSSQLEYDKTLSYFKSTYQNVYKAEKVNTNDYQMLFYLHPYPNIYNEKSINFSNVSLNTILLHSSYSYMLAGNMSKLNIWLYHLAFTYYTDTNFYKTLLEKTDLYTGNAKYLGFPKMDQYYEADCKRRSSKKIIIYAPHHSVNYTEFKSATFEDNYLSILELAKKYADSTYWIYKPHPLLRPHSVVAGVFDSVEEYDRYVEEWNSLENADVVTSGDYFPIFKESDAMITDSVSFLAEYQFTHKPLLLLESGKEKYNDFGNSILDILYRCPGDDITGIERFIQDSVSGKDEMKEKRMAFFEENLSYRKNSMSANYRIYKDILELTGKEEKNEEEI